jgi:predicted esterase
VEEAKEMARSGAVCLLIETLWSDPDFFLKRTQSEDIQNSIEEVINIRRATDLLLAQSNVDARRFAFVGHDFGGMYGVLAGSLDQRPTHYVVMAATPRFPDWYLYSPKLEGQVRETFIRQFSPFDPIVHIPNLSPAQVFFQFATDDPHVPKERAEEFFSAAKEPKEMCWYEAGHGLNEQATLDRKSWLREELGLQA